MKKDKPHSHPQHPLYRGLLMPSQIPAGDLSIDFSQLTGSASDAQVPESAVTQHEGALALDGSQVTSPTPTGLFLKDDGTYDTPIGTGTPALDDLTDVNAPTPADGDVLTWDDSAGEWIAAAPTGGGGGSTPVADSMTTGTVKTNVDAVDPVVYLKGSVDTLLVAKAPLASPALTGSPTAPTQSPGDNSTKVATTAYVDAAVTAGGGGGGSPTNYPMVYSRSTTAYIALPASAVWSANTGTVFTIEFLILIANYASYAGPIAFGPSGDDFIVYCNSGKWDVYPTSLPSGDLAMQREGRVRRVSITRNGTSVKVYLDGALIDVLTWSTGAALSFSGSQRRLMGDGAGEGMKGQGLADMRIWSTERTAQEVADNAFARLTGSETGLLNYWPMDEGTGTAVADLGPANEDGTLTGSLGWITTYR